MSPINASYNVSLIPPSFDLSQSTSLLILLACLNSRSRLRMFRLSLFAIHGLSLRFVRNIFVGIVSLAAVKIAEVNGSRQSTGCAAAARLQLKQLLVLPGLW